LIYTQDEFTSHNAAEFQDIKHNLQHPVTQFSPSCFRGKH